MASGALCMTHRYAGLHLDFTSGENLVAWDSFEHLKEQIDYYIANDLERQRIAKNGCELVHTTHTFDTMISNLLKIYERR
jgi:spore maturation protein CgeB